MCKWAWKHFLSYCEFQKIWPGTFLHLDFPAKSETCLGNSLNPFIKIDILLESKIDFEKSIFVNYDGDMTLSILVKIKHDILHKIYSAQQR